MSQEEIIIQSTGCSYSFVGRDGNMMCMGKEDECVFYTAKPNAWRCRDEYSFGPCAIYDDTEYDVGDYVAYFNLSPKLIKKCKEVGLELNKIVSNIIDQYYKVMVVFERYYDNIDGVDIAYRYITETEDGETQLKFFVKLKEEE